MSQTPYSPFADLEKRLMRATEDAAKLRAMHDSGRALQDPVAFRQQASLAAVSLRCALFAVWHMEGIYSTRKTNSGSGNVVHLTDFDPAAKRYRKHSIRKGARNT